MSAAMGGNTAGVAGELDGLRAGEVASADDYHVGLLRSGSCYRAEEGEGRQQNGADECLGREEVHIDCRLSKMRRELRMCLER